MHIVLATDGSENGNAGVDLLLAAGPLPGERISVLVVQPENAIAARGLTAPEDGIDTGDVAARIAGWQADRLKAARFDAEPVVAHGDPAEAIVRAARQGRADLIIIGIQGSSMVRRLLIGSVSAAVARLASMPVLLTRAPVSLERMLVVSDNTEQSIRAAQIAAAMPARLLRQASFLHVNSAGVVGPTIRAAIESASTRLSDAGVHTEIMERTGNEVDVMVHEAELMDATLIVVAASDNRFDGEPVLGTTAHGLLERASASVLIAR